MNARELVTGLGFVHKDPAGDGYDARWAPLMEILRDELKASLMERAFELKAQGQTEFRVSESEYRALVDIGRTLESLPFYGWVEASSAGPHHAFNVIIEWGKP